MSKKKDYLEELTSDILLQSDMYKLPVGVIKIANDCGIEVYEKDMGNDISGKITYDKTNKEFYITVNKNNSKERQRFSVAHELGHYFLHKDILVKEETHIDTLYRANDIKDEEARKREKEVDYFAGALLMNKLMLENLYEDYDIASLADIFKVSVSAMTVRMDILGLL